MVEPTLYSKYSDLQKTDNTFVLDKYLRLVKWKDGKESVLDIGCGDGKFAVYTLIPRLPKGYEKFVGCDISESMVHFADENYDIPNTNFVQLDISTDIIPDEFLRRFNHIFSFYALHWVDKQRQAFENMFKMLKPGGDMLLTFLATNPIYDVYKNMSKNVKWKSYTKKEHIGPYHGSKEPEKEVEKLLIDTGFVSHVCRVEKRTYAFPNFEILEKSIAAVNPIIQTLSKDDVANYIDDFINEVRKLDSVTINNFNNNNEESITIRHELFVVFASKPLEKS